MIDTITNKNLKLTSNMVYVNEKTFNKCDILYTIAKVLKSAIQWQNLQKF